MFYHEGNNEYNLHFGDPWKGEVQVKVAFFAFKEDPAEKNKMRLFLSKVNLSDITATSSTKLAAVNVNIDNMQYADFSQQFKTTNASQIVHALMNELFGKVSVGLGSGV